MKQSMKESLMNGFLGKLLIAAVTLGIAFMGFKTIQPEISTEGIGIIVMVIVMLFVVCICLLPAACVYGPALLSEKIEAGVTKQKNKDDSEIKKSELENEKIVLQNEQIKLQNEQLALQNRQLELQKENQQSSPEE